VDTLSQDYKDLNEQLKISVINLLHEWLPGGQVLGDEYCCGDFTGRKGKSLKVNLNSTLWSDFATGESGGDLISLYARIKSIGNYEAFQQLASLGGIALDTVDETNPKFPKIKDEIEMPPEVHEVPVFRLGNTKASHFWTYKNHFGRVMFYIARFEMADKDGEISKEFRPYTWKGGVFTNKMWPVPRPLYGLEQLNDKPDKSILIVEGEKAADAAREIAGKYYLVVTWPGGANAVDKIDWHSLKGREILIWPDNDEPGREAARKIVGKLNKICKLVKILQLEKSSREIFDGWDAADALGEGMTWDEFKAWAKPIALICEKLPEPEVIEPPPKEKAPAKKKTEVKEYTSEDRAKFAVWDEVLYAKNGGGTAPLSNVANCQKAIKYLIGREFDVWYDEFYMTVFVRWMNQEPRAWTDQDDTRISILVQEVAKLEGAKIDQVARAVQLYAHNHPRNEARDYLESIKWDGVSRAAMFFTEYFGAEESAYISAVSQNFWVAMAARVLSPGCKFDNMVILEGVQGARKSTALSCIGGKWFTEADEKMGTKDFYQKIQGHLLVEIAELDSFQRSEVTTIKNVLSQRVDRFRPPYGKNTAAFPRQCIFVGTTNDDGYLKDPTGARRFWPVKTGKIDIESLIRDRDQLFAEAVHLFKEGVTYWEVPKEEAEVQQAERADVDAWTDIINLELLKTDRTSVSEVLISILKFDTPRIDRGSQMRVAAILKRLGWRKAKRKWNGVKTNPNEWERINPYYETREIETESRAVTGPPSYFNEVPMPTEPEFDFETT
jgi:putative DNA primase/helicase